MALRGRRRPRVRKSTAPRPFRSKHRPGPKHGSYKIRRLLQASADITNGVAKTTDLNIASQNLRVTGQGSTNPVTDAIDYQIKATLYKEAPTAIAGGGEIPGGDSAGRDRDDH